MATQLMLLAQVQQQSLLFWFLQSHYSLALLAMAAAIAFLGIFLWFRPNRTASIVLVFVAFLPGFLAAGLVYFAASNFSEMARSPTAPRPTEMAQTIGMALSSGLFGLLATLIPLLIAVIALLRAGSADHGQAES